MLGTVQIHGRRASLKLECNGYSSWWRVEVVACRSGVRCGSGLRLLFYERNIDG